MTKIADGTASRYDQQNALLGKSFDAIHKSKVLMVGAGGIGCEVTKRLELLISKLLKNLVMSGFVDIYVVCMHSSIDAEVDLDIIDVSNLNRQFLFQKQHVKMSKASVRYYRYIFNMRLHVRLPLLSIRTQRLFRIMPVFTSHSSLSSGFRHSTL